MLKTIKYIVLPTLWVNLKSLRMNMIQYVMLVVIFPVSYLAVNLASSGENSRVYCVTGMYISMLLSLFVNMQAAQVSSGNQIAILEMYSVYQVNPFFVYFSQCILHYGLSLILLAVAVASLAMMGVGVIWWRIFIWVVLSFFFLQSFAVFLGGILKNPNVAGPMINLVYMLLVIVTPVYTPVEGMTAGIAMAYGCNPFAHLISLFYWSFGRMPFVLPGVSVVLLLVVSTILEYYCVRRWRESRAAEKLTIFA